MVLKVVVVGRCASSQPSNFNLPSGALARSGAGFCALFRSKPAESEAENDESAPRGAGQFQSFPFTSMIFVGGLLGSQHLNHGAYSTHKPIRTVLQQGVTRSLSLSFGVAEPRAARNDSRRGG